MSLFDVQACRREFPALARTVGGRPAVFFDGPAGSQVPGRVADAVAAYLTRDNANTGGFFPTSVRTAELLDLARETFAAFLGADDRDCVVFGPNMTTLTMHVSAALARTWEPGDEIVVTRSEHDANFTPWIRAAHEAGATVRHVGIRAADATIDLDEFRAALGDRTRLVALGCASNALGTLHPFARMVELARAAGALTFLDAVHYAPHAAIDVAAWDCDLLVCSAYKFFGPHLGVLWGRRDLLETLPAFRLRPVADRVPDRWMPGTPNHEGIVGASEAVKYLADLGQERGASLPIRDALLSAFAAIGEHESGLCLRLLEGLAALPDVRVWGIADPRRIAERVPTLGFTHARLSPEAIARRLAERGIFVWHGDFYAVPLAEALGLEPQGLVRVGLLHYNTADEVDRLLNEVAALG